MIKSNYLPSKSAVDAQLSKMNDGAIGRSKNHSKLLAYLIDRELAIEVDSDKGPKETEIAIDVFGKSGDFSAGDDSTVRVNISNLRKKLESFYTNEGYEEAFFITIPVGGYRLTFTENIKGDIPQQANSQKQYKKLTFLIPLLMLTLSISLFFNLFLIFKPETLALKPSIVSPLNQDDQARNSVINKGIWADLTSSPKPTMVVLGDVHNFIETDDKKDKQRTIIDPTIHNDDDLMAFLKEHPEQSLLTQRSQQIMITRGTSLALRNFIRLFGNFKGMNLRFASELDAYQLRGFNIIYIGPLNSMGILEEYFKSSQFNLNKNKNSLLKKHSTKRLDAPSDLLESYVDYGLFAKVDGPQSNQLYIMSGFNDSSLMKLSWYLTDKKNLLSDELANFFQQYQLAPSDNFEMLFKVPSMNGVDMEYDIIYGGKINSDAIWKISAH